VLTYNYRSTEENPDGSPKTRWLWNTTEVYARFGEAWRIVHTHWSFVDHEAPEAVELPVPIELKPQNPTGVLAELLALERAAMERWRKGDPWGFTDLSAPSVTYFDQLTPRRVDGLAALREMYGKIAGQVHFDVTDFVAPRAQARGDAAVLSYRFVSGRLRPDGTLEPGAPWNCTEVFARLAGQWRIVHTHWSLINGRQKQANTFKP
jgi:ketosteroid isomerase-like protein